MGRSAFVPAELMAGPFTLSDAVRAGLNRWHLEGTSWRRIGPTVYVWSGLPETPELKIEAVRRRLPPTAVFSGLTAAWLHRLHVKCEPIEVTIPKGIRPSPPTRLLVPPAPLPPNQTLHPPRAPFTSPPQ